jgi:hypothetical protein
MSRGEGGLLIPALLLALAVVTTVHHAAVAEAQPTPPPPCSALVFKRTTDSLYAELQAPVGTKSCTVEIKG